ncbi:MAG: peroxiredoxin family protein [Fimbriimonadaceae bacterium]|nr:peroxiredoxin family protein [Fimbriimonadaceae bacterium]
MNNKLFGLIIAFVAVASGTGLLFLLPREAQVARQPQAATATEVRASDEKDLGEDLLLKTRNWKNQQALDFRLPGTDGKTHTLASLTDGKPLMLFFIEKDCPCCITAQPFFNALGSAYKGQANVYGVINSDLAFAERWKKATDTTFPLLIDPKRDLIDGMNAEQALYTAIISPNRIVTLYLPGYSKALLGELDRELARLTGIPPKSLDVSEAPDEITTGCSFITPKKSPPEQENPAASS